MADDSINTVASGAGTQDHGKPNPIYASVEDVEIELGRPTSGEKEAAQWEAWLARVERAIAMTFRRAGLDLEEQVDKGDPPASVVADVAVAAVIRKINNPTGLTSVTRSLDDGSITHRRDYGADVDPLALLPDEIDALLPGSVTAAFSTRPGFEPDGDAGYDPWWEVGQRLGPNLAGKGIPERPSGRY